MMPSHTVRTFVAVPIEASPSLKRMVRTLDQLGPGMKTADLDSLHVTLMFLGETFWTQLPEISAIIEETVSGYASCEARIIGLGAFPDAQRPRIVWAGLTPAETITDVARQLNDQLGDLGFPRENRDYTPHVTLARAKSRPPRELGTLIESSSQTDFGGITIDQAILYQSAPGPRGPVYTPISRHNLR